MIKLVLSRLQEYNVARNDAVPFASSLYTLCDLCEDIDWKTRRARCFSEWRNWGVQGQDSWQWGYPAKTSARRIPMCLNDSDTVHNSSMQNGSMIHVVLHLVGGWDMDVINIALRYCFVFVSISFLPFWHRDIPYTSKILDTFLAFSATPSHAWDCRRARANS